ncbi:MAG TPA: class I adenylate-forming enzyme family protein [Stellaceae bacterium]|jgi:acyl-coenzyme A synthetase/AMP-(fatty) acid ligase|nr:class I adenylate-forming enzyme family protein [Stellaceae bacterium]
MNATWQNLSDPIFDHAARRPDAPALIEGPTILSYGALAALVAKASVYLRDLGIGPSMRVGIALANSIGHVILLFAVMRLGAVPAELSAEDSGEALAATARKYGMRAVFTEAHVTLPPGPAQHRMTLGWRDEIARKSGDSRATASADELQTITLTTGSTGVPGGIVTTHGQLFRRFEAQRAVFQEHRLYEPPGGTLILTASIRYGAFFRFLLGQVIVGGVSVILPDFAKPIELVRAIAAYDDVVGFVTANMCRLFIAAAPDGALLFPKVRLLVAGGLPLYADEKRAMIARVTPNFYEGYGTSGIAVISSLSPAEIPAKADTVGRPVAGVAVEIVDDRDQRLPPGTYGTIRCRSDLVSLGRCAEDGNASAEHFRDGWYYPGDVGALDAEGYLHLRGRVAEIIRRGAIDVFTADVEAALAAHPAVAEAAVVGIPSPTQGEEVVAFVVKTGALTHDELVRHCVERLAPVQRPDRVFYIEALPRIAGGKVDRARLQSLALSDAVRQAASG